MENVNIKDKNDRYYNIEKTRLISLIPEGPHKVFDLGCATGRVGLKLRELKKASEVIGMEIYQPAAQEAQKHYNKIYIADIEAIELEYYEYFDYVICGDILEHLRDPWTVLKRIHKWLKKEGLIIVSIPNIRYWRVLRNLLFYGRWDYVEAGILDNTHLRFFTRKSFIEGLKRERFIIEHQEMVINGVKQKIFNKLTFSLFKEFMGSQVIVLARKMVE